MLPIVIDTDVVSYWYRGVPAGAPYREVLATRRPLISFQTLAELYRMPRQNSWGAARQAAFERYAGSFDVAPYSDALAREWADIMVASRWIGRGLAVGDAWIAATARLYTLPLATHNRRHFEVVERLELISFAP